MGRVLRGLLAVMLVGAGALAHTGGSPISGLLGDDVPIFPVSARRATRGEDPAFDVFREAISTYLDEQRQQTQVSLRNIAGRPELAGSIQLEIETTDAKPVVIHRRQTKGTMGAMTLAWDGRGNDGKARGRGRYRAKVSFLDAKGRSLQTEQVVFLHDTRAAQKAAYAEVEGRIGLSAQDNKSSANTLVELVDDDGNVVQSTRTTAQGNYRFKNVDQGKYRVRVKKEGWKTQEAEVDAKRDAAPAAASISL